MLSKPRFLVMTLMAAFLLAAPPALAKNFRKDTILDVLTQTDGAQALVAAVLVVDEAQVLDFSLATLLGDKRADLVLFAPGNAAFEDLLGLDSGTLDGLTIEQVKEALPGLLPEGVGAEEVAAILLKHAGTVRKASFFSVSSGALLRAGSVDVADGSELAVGIGAQGVSVNYETTIIRGDVRTRNGYIHFVDTVILDGLLDAE